MDWPREPKDFVFVGMTNGDTKGYLRIYAADDEDMKVCAHVFTRWLELTEDRRVEWD